MKVDLDTAYVPSDDIVARNIEGEIIIVPLVSGIADLEDELFTLNDTGKAIWEKLDGANTVKAIIDYLRSEYDAPEGTIESDVSGLVKELVTRRILVDSKTVSST